MSDTRTTFRVVPESDDVHGALTTVRVEDLRPGDIVSGRVVREVGTDWQSQGTMVRFWQEGHGYAHYLLYGPGALVVLDQEGNG